MRNSFQETGFPRVEIDLDALEHNVREVVRMCQEKGVALAGIIKGTTGVPECAEAFAHGGVEYIGSSRLEQIEDAIEYGIKKPMMLIRVPMLSEVREVIRLTDLSLNSEIEVLKALDKEAENQRRTHKVILMADLGDLREGFWGVEAMLEAAVLVEEELTNLELAGVGTNLGCYGSILATKEKLQELVDIAEAVEEKIGRKLEFISGGATSSLMRVMDGDLPERINFLRVGEGILNARDLNAFFGYDLSNLRQDVYTLRGEIIELKDKPSYPQGEFSVDAFGKKPVYEDRGVRKRALIALGKVDYGSIEEIFPKDEGVVVLGASSDHTILDVESCKRTLKVGDVLDFGIDYASLVYVTNCRNVKIVFKQEEASIF